MRRALRFKVGDRVRIVGSHSWTGHVGVVFEALAVDGLDWSVQLDGLDRRAGCGERNLQAARL